MLALWHVGNLTLFFFLPFPCSTRGLLWHFVVKALHGVTLWSGTMSHLGGELQCHIQAAVSTSSVYFVFRVMAPLKGGSSHVHPTWGVPAGRGPCNR